MLNRSNNYFEILEIQPTTDLDLIRKAYKKLALMHHPDKGGNVEDFKLLANIIGQLSDDRYRGQYYGSIKNNIKLTHSFEEISTQQAYEIYNNINEMIRSLDRMIERTDKVILSLDKLESKWDEKMNKISGALDEIKHSLRREDQDAQVFFKKNVNKRKIDDEDILNENPSKKAKK